MLPPPYLVLRTPDAGLAERARRLFSAVDLNGGTPGLHVLGTGLTVPHLRSINAGVPGEWLEATASWIGSRFSARTDFWGLQNHFYFHQDGTFACSDSLFLLKDLFGSLALDPDALRECLFFTAPQGQRTWFSELSTLLPGQGLSYDPETDQLTQNAAVDPIAYFEEEGSSDLVEEGHAFFQSLRCHVGDQPAHLSLSAGSDSRVILAALRHFGFRHKAYCFGKSNYTEKDKVRALTHRLHTELEFVELSDFEEQFGANLSAGMRQSNGYMNPLRTHYMEYYRQLPTTGVFCEGILGSEFVKGEISCPTMTSNPMKLVISHGKSVQEALDLTLPQVSSPVRREAATYIQDTHGDLLQGLDHARGRRAYAAFAFQFIPRRIFAGIVPLAQATLSLVAPNLHPPFLRAVYRSGHGLLHRSSLDPTFPSGLKSIVPQALLVRSLDPHIFQLRLDRGISYRQSLLPTPLGWMLRAINLTLERGLRDRRMFHGQIDNSHLIQRIGTWAEELQSPVVESTHPGPNLDLCRILVSYDVIQRL